MKIGDIVKQGDRVVKFKGRGQPKRSEHLGIVVDIREMPAARENETQRLRDMMDMLGRQVDVLWETGKLTKGFAENSLDVVSESHSHQHVN